MPGIRDRVKVTKNVYAQKRLMPCNLRELYGDFKRNYPKVKVRFSKFCEMKHGKTSCDGIGGLFKRMAAIERLKRPYNNEIL